LVIVSLEHKFNGLIPKLIVGKLHHSALRLNVQRLQGVVVRLPSDSNPKYDPYQSHYKNECQKKQYGVAQAAGIFLVV
jgi:hypothetical protein